MSNAGSYARILLGLSLLSVTVMSRGQTASGSKCPPVKPKNAEEALRIEQSSNKNGCWVRDSTTGQLVFVSSKAPDQNHTPLVKQQSAPTVKPSCQTSSGGAGSGITGTWLWEERCTSGCTPATPTDYVGAETLTITPLGPMLFQVGFGSYPGANECMVPVRLTQITPSNSSATFVRATGAAPAQQYCGTPPTIEVETRGATLYVRMHRTDVWEGTACRTSLPPGVWIPHNPFDPSKGMWLEGGRQLNGPF